MTDSTAKIRKTEEKSAVEVRRKGKQWPHFSLAWQGDATYNPE